MHRMTKLCTQDRAWVAFRVKDQRSRSATWVYNAHLPSHPFKLPSLLAFVFALLFVVNFLAFLGITNNFHNIYSIVLCHLHCRYVLNCLLIRTLLGIVHY